MSDDGPVETGPMDPELTRELERLSGEESVRDLYWALIEECEERCLPLFQGLSSFYLGEWLQGP
jgi:hypothetical protein